MSNIVKRFESDTAKHELTVLHDDGLYRHLRFSNPRNSAYWFDLVTWPGTLAIKGDMGCFVFSRELDMLPFMRRAGREISYGYWAEKEQSGAPKKEYSEDRFAETVWTYVREGGQEYRGLAKAVQGEIFDTGYSLDEQTARQALEEFEYSDSSALTGPDFPFTFDDVWEMTFGDWTTQFLWCCHAIAWGIGQYDLVGQSEATAMVGGAR